MIIRQLTVDDVAKHNEVSSAAFLWQVDDKVDVELPKNCEVWGAFTDDGKTLMADLECIPRKIYFGNTTLGCVGIGGVASKPEYRREGAVRALFNKVFELAPEKGWDTSILYPFSFTFYRLFGYEAVTEHIKANVEFAAISGIERSSSVELCKEEQLPRLLKVYNEYASRTALMFVRENGVYFNLDPYHTCAYTYIWMNSAGEDRGYVSYTVDRDNSCVNVREIAFLDREALLGLLGYLRCYDGNYKTLNFEKLSGGSPVLEVIAEPRKYKRTINFNGAVRVISLENVLKANAYPKESGKFSFMCNDTIAENNGVFTVEYANGVCEVVRGGTEYDFSVTAAAASRLFTSFEGLSEYDLSCMSGFEQKRDISDMLRAFPKKSAGYWDGF